MSGFRWARSRSEGAHQDSDGLPDQSTAGEARQARRAGDALPAGISGKEIDDATLEANADTIFEEAENRLHVQKAILNWAVS